MSFPLDLGAMHSTLIYLDEQKRVQENFWRAEEERRQKEYWRTIEALTNRNALTINQSRACIACSNYGVGIHTCLSRT